VGNTERTNEERNPAIPGDLLQPPVGEPPPPPVDTAAQVLPFNDLAWENFERLCVRLALFEGTPEHVQRYGVAGQGQEGIDIYSRQSDGEYAVYQCKRYAQLDPSDIVHAVDAFVEGEWAEKSTRLVFCTSHSVVRRQLADAVEEQARRLAGREPPVAFEVWDEDRLSIKLKAHPGLVRDFFGAAWLERFSNQPVEIDRDEQLGELQASIDDLRTRSIEQVRLVTLDWAPRRLRGVLEQLEEEQPSQFRQLTDQVGTPPSPGLVAATASTPPGWLASAESRLWVVLARIAESVGEWHAAGTAWQEAANREEDDSEKAGLLAFAAVAAHVRGDDEARGQLLDAARGIDPEHPRLALSEVPDALPPHEELERLHKIHSDDPDVSALISGRKAIACLLIPDLDRARDHLREVEEQAPESSVAEAVAINLIVQEGRLNVLAGRPLDAPGLKSAEQRALTLRDRLLREKRWEESGRLLMMAADANSLLVERTAASDLLREADPAEISARDGRVVLADCAASRALDFRLALEILGSANDSPAIRRIRAEALEYVGNAEERAEALATLEELFEADGPEAPEAAFIRLAATLGGRRTDWSDEAAQYLREHGHERAAVTAEAVYQARWHSDYERVEEVLRPHLSETWAKSVRLRLAIQRGRYDPIREAADDLLAVGPSQALRFEAGAGFAKCRDFDRAREILLSVARDPSAPRLVRADAYHLLMHVAGNGQDDWQLASELHREWSDLTPGDPRASQFAVRIANRLLRRRRPS
jgi:hypothetical protein